MLKSRNHSLRPLRSTRGFSLLELMIVLVVIAGLLALAWPNLQRPLKRAGLSQATQQLREVIDESRYQAISKGTPVFIRLKLGESQVVAGGFDTFASTNPSTTAEALGRDLLAPDTSPVSKDSRDPARVAPKVWKLPDSIVISDVVWSDGLADETSNEPDSGLSEGDAAPSPPSDSNTTGNRESSGAGGSGRAEIEQMAEGFDSVQGSEQIWWLPVSSLHQGRDVEITLWDKNSHESMRVSLSSATGELEIHR